MFALADRDSNSTPTSHPQGKQCASGEENNRPQESSSQQHRNVLDHKGNDKQYVSPSDAILSPASRKLSSFKQRQIDKAGAKNAAARTLFARTPSGASDVEGAERKA